MKRRAFATLSFALCALFACGAGNTLEGSLSDEASLSFDQVQVQISNSAAAVIYLQSLPAGGGEDTVFKVVATTTGLDLTKGITIDLTQQINGGPRGAVARVDSQDANPNPQFPPIVRGSLSFDNAPTVGTSVTGSFTVTFGQGGTLGAGRTVFGDFSAPVTAAGQ